MKPLFLIISKQNECWVLANSVFVSVRAQAEAKILNADFQSKHSTFLVLFILLFIRLNYISNRYDCRVSNDYFVLSFIASCVVSGSARYYMKWY